MISLKYGNYTSGTLNLSTAMDFTELIFHRIPTVTHSSGRDLRQTNYVHVLGSHNIYVLTISADELYQTIKKEFLLNLFKASAVFFSQDNWDTSYEVVLEKDGELPIEWIEDFDLLPEITLRLIDKESA